MSNLNELRIVPLPSGWGALDFVEDTIVADGLTLHRAGVCTIRAQSGEEITGSAVSLNESGPPLQRGYFELLERVSTLEAIAAPGDDEVPVYDVNRNRVGTLPRARVFPLSDEPTKWSYARSNGVALHEDWNRAAARAAWELTERDRILRSWCGEIVPEPLRGVENTALASARSFEWQAFRFPEPQAGFGSDLEVVGVFGFPKGDDVPFVAAYAARPGLDDALVAATVEGAQGLGFLWGEARPTSAPPAGPSAMHHLERLQWSGQVERVRSWLRGAHAPLALPPKVRAAAALTYVDLTPDWMPTGRVVKAVCAAAQPLMFGDSPAVRHLPDALRIHPIA